MSYVVSFCPLFKDEKKTCMEIPQISILANNKDIIIKCPCGYTDTISLDKYLKSLVIESCVGILLEPPEIKDAAEKLKQAEEFVNVYLEQLKNEAIELKEKSDEVKAAYEKCKEMNHNVVYLIRRFFSNLFRDNDNLVKNIKNSCTFNLTKCDYVNATSKIDKIIDFFNTFTIYQKIDNNDYLFIDTKFKFPEHKDTVNGLKKLKDGRIAFYSFEKTIEILDPKNNYHIDLVIKGHPGGVLALDQFDNGDLVSVSGQHVMLWSITKDSYKCLHTIPYGEFKYLWFVAVCGDKRIAVANDTVIHVYEFNEGYVTTPAKELTQHTKIIKNLYYAKSKDLLLSSGEDGMLYVWNMSTYELLAQFGNCSCVQLNAIQPIDEDRVYANVFGEIKVINLKTFREEKDNTIKEVGCVLSYAILRHKNTLLLGGYYSEMRVYKVDEKETNDFKSGCKDNIEKLCVVDDHHIISLTKESNEIKLWEY